MDVHPTVALSRRRQAVLPPRRARVVEGTPSRVELIQRGRMLVDIAGAALTASEARLGPFHEETTRLRQTHDDARRAWDHLRAVLGTPALDAALSRPPLRPLALPGDPRARFLLIAGATYRAERLAGSDLAPRLFHLRKLPEHEDGPYHACRLRDGSTQCDCAEWFFHVLDMPDAAPCKHLDALSSLGWI